MRNLRLAAPWLMVLALAAQQLGIGAHNAMQMRHALGGPDANFCTVRADRTSGPAQSVPDSPERLAGAQCAPCAGALAAALSGATLQQTALAVAGVSTIALADTPSVAVERRRIPQSRAPPLVIA